MEKKKNEQISTNMEHSKEQFLSMDAGAVETGASVIAKNTKRLSSPKKGEKGDDVDPNFIINSFRSSDVSIPIAARVSEGNVTTDETSAKEDQAISDGQSDEPKPNKKQKTMPVKAKGSPNVEAYISTFYKNAGISPKTGKTAYLCNEHHERIQKLVRVVGKGETTLFSYLYNVLEEHFINLREEIEEAYKANNSIY